MNAGIIKFIGLEDLEETEQQMVKDIAEQHSLDIQRIMKNLTNLVLHVKAYGGEGKRAKYSVNLKVESPTATIASDKTAEWDLQKAIGTAFRKLERELLHRFHSDTSLGRIR